MDQFISGVKVLAITVAIAATARTAPAFAASAAAQGPEMLSLRAVSGAARTAALLALDDGEIHHNNDKGANHAHHNHRGEAASMPTASYLHDRFLV